MLLLVCMVMVVQYVITAPSIMEVSLLLWMSFASLLLLFVVSLSILVCCKFVVVVCRKFICCCLLQVYLLLFIPSMSFVVCRKSVSCCLSQVCLLLFIVSLSLIVCCCYLSLFHVVLNYEVFRNCNEGARTRALMKLIILCPPPPFVSLVF
jgi:hypothetical protein